MYKSNLRFLHDKYSQAEMDVLFELAAKPPDFAIPWTPYLTVLIKRSIEAGLLTVVHPPKNMYVKFGGIDAMPVRILITPKGRQYVADLGVNEL